MFTHARSRSLLIDADPAVIAAAVPAVPLAGPGFKVAAKHTVATTIELRKLGYEAPSPIVSYYDWPKYRGQHAPFGHQRLMSEFLTLHRRCFNLAEMGAGKTNAALWAADWLMQEKEIKRVLILAPLSTLERVWMQGVTDTIMHRRACVVHGSREKRLSLLRGPYEIFILNHEGLTIKAVREAVRAMDPDLVIVDEGSKYRNAKTDKYRCLEAVVSKPKVRLWWLTGTPTPSGPDDAWAQARLVNPAAVPRFFGTFRNQVMIEMAQHVWKPRAGHERVVHTALQPAIRIAKADCLDLPPMVTVDWACEMSEEQKHVYKQMAHAMQVADHAAAKQGVMITAVNAADRINKLRQIMLGAVKAGPDEYQVYDYGPRFKLLCEAIDSASAKAVVVAPFKGIIQDLEKRLSERYTVGMVNGDVSIGRRNKIFADFKENRDPHVLLCHPEVMSHGLNLTEADFLILFGPIYSNDVYRQVVERINRPPQTKKMTVVRIGCNPIEWAIYKSLDSDEQQQQLILNLYRSIIKES